MRRSTKPADTDERIKVHHGDCMDVIKTIPDNSIDSVVTDPPYALVSITKRFSKTSQEDDTDTSERARNASDQYARLGKGFMGFGWDNGKVAFSVEFWEQVFRVLKPGGYVLSFGGTRTYHRLACAIEDAGFDIREIVLWVYGTGFPKSHNVSKAIDRQLGMDRTKVRHKPRPITSGTIAGKSETRPCIERSREQGFHESDSDEPISDEAVTWQGWGTTLKPSFEPVCMARKPLIGTVAENVMEHGTGGLNIDECRVGDHKRVPGSLSKTPNNVYGAGLGGHAQDGSEGGHNPNIGRWPANVISDGTVLKSATRYFYSAKADEEDRCGSKHPTVKPVDLIAYLTRLVTPKGGTVLDPFAGSGTTGVACIREGFKAILIEREQEYYDDITRRIKRAYGRDTPLGGLF